MLPHTERMDADGLLPDCCGRPMRFVRSIPNFGTLSPLQKFQCDTCGIGRMFTAEPTAGAELKAPVSRGAGVARTKPASLAMFEKIRKTAYARFADMRAVDCESFDRLRTRAS